MQPPPPSYEASVGVLGTQIDEGGGKEFLAGRQWPMGLQNYVMTTVTKTPYRFFICDDSGGFNRVLSSPLVAKSIHTVQEA